MDAEYFLTVANQTMWVLALAAAPILIPALLTGLITGMIQAATSINEQTLSFVPKLIVVGVSILVFGSLILGLLT
ncbi:flagellar biosynthetic protein FliQ, partial [Pseudomonas sp. FW305-130]